MSAKKKKAAPPESAPPSRTGILIVAIFAIYAAALIYARESVPPGMNNDVAEEALRGIYLVEGHHLEAMTFSVGNSAETLYLYLVGAAAQLFGPTTLAIQLVSWLFALACIWLIWKLTERISDTLPPWIPLLTAACSLWLFHYARNGLRAIAAPFFLAAFALLLDRAERRPPDRRFSDRWFTDRAALLCGAVLGLSLYGYTSARALPLAFLAYAVFRLVRQADIRPQLLRRYAAILAGAFLTSIPNLLFFLRHPKEFLSRGDYVMAGTAADYAVQLLWSILLPLYYPDHYRHIQIDHYRSDGVAAGLTSAGHNPLQIVFAVAFLIGLSRLKRYISKPAAAFLVCAWIVATLSLGIAGPSVTRLLILLPVFLVFAALGIGRLWESLPKFRIPLLVVMLAAGASEGYSYFSATGQNPDYRMCYDPAPMAIGQRAEALAAEGKRVMCVISRDYSVVNYFAHRHSGSVKILEFFVRPFDPSKIPFNEFRPDVLLIQNVDKFRNFVARAPAEWRVGNDDRYYELRLPPR